MLTPLISENLFHEAVTHTKISQTQLLPETDNHMEEEEEFYNHTWRVTSMRLMYQYNKYVPQI